ncbi:outer membrane protein [Myxococcota bacterium]
MIPVLLAGLASAPAWTADLELQPKPPDSAKVSAPDVPEGVVVMPPRRKASLKVKGPGVLRVRAWGLMKKAGLELSDPGRLRIWIGTVRRKNIELSTKPLEGWRVRGKPRWRVSEERELTVPLAKGTHRVSISHQLKRGAIGYALLVAVEPPETTPETPEPAASVTTEEPPQTPAPDARPDIEAEVTPEQEEPNLVANPTPAPEPGFEVRGSPERHRVNGPGGIEEVIRMGIDPSLELGVVGPGSLVLRLHAHRSQTRPETLEPVVLAILLDDVLVQTVALDQAPTNDYAAEGNKFWMSGPATVRVPVPAGSHKLQLSLSDNAVLGASVKPRFGPLAADEPEVLDIGAARRDDLRAVDSAAPKGGVGIAVLGGLWTPHALSEVGGGGLLEGSYAIPVVDSRLLINLSVGLGYTDATRHIPDADVPKGRSRVRVKISAVPLLLGATWSAPMPIRALTIDAGAGAGVVLSWTTTRSRKAEESSGEVAPALGINAGVGYALGPGAALLRFHLITGLPWSDNNINSFDPGSVMVGLGYRVDLGG